MEKYRVMAVVLAGLTALALIFAGACFTYARRNAVIFVYAEAAVPVFASGSPQILSFAAAVDRTESSPILPISWADGIFFDTYTNVLTFPPEIGTVTVEQNYYRREHSIIFEDIELVTQNFPLMPYGIFAMRALVFEEGRVQIRTRHGALIETAGSYIQIIDPREHYHTVVIIDAGHGGHDSGAPSALGRNDPGEAQIVLAISQKLIEIFDHPKILLIPTRTCDYFLSTEQRARIANNIGDYFISIHCNADTNRRSNGTLTLYGVAQGSHDLARVFQDALVATLESYDRGVHFAPRFRILRESRLPAVILELLFLSNPEDATHLSDPDVQTLIAETIAETIKTLPPAR